MTIPEGQATDWLNTIQCGAKPYPYSEETRALFLDLSEKLISELKPIAALRPLEEEEDIQALAVELAAAVKEGRQLDTTIYVKGLFAVAMNSLPPVNAKTGGRDGPRDVLGYDKDFLDYRHYVVPLKEFFDRHIDAFYLNQTKQRAMQAI